MFPNHQSPLKEANADMLLWSAFQNGDRKAFASIYQKYIDELLSYGYRVTSDRQLIRDSVQDLFLHIWVRRGNLAVTDSIKFYLFRSLRNRIIRNLEKHPERLHADIGMVAELAEDSNVFESAIFGHDGPSDSYEKLAEAVNRLSPRQREAVQLRYLHGFSLDEIAEMMQMNNQSVRNLLHRAILQLRLFFETAGGLLVFLSALQNFSGR
ncbi:RNA polymerase sigma factor (sigma-70 family) [Dyadobacter jiangsuensis]|uniref:RNA polymerase sigma factor (Sigma-70 family) n=1 Tax=Dyadobacter jiangsuensis TaxID=1591085 RepID=A0A2P8FNF5_9BACT|nr:RNA polymerase sigma factor (sigma-70 family) [Dyadobacter jiangsuensis]